MVFFPPATPIKIQAIARTASRAVHHIDSWRLESESTLPGVIAIPRLPRTMLPTVSARVMGSQRLLVTRA